MGTFSGKFVKLGGRVHTHAHYAAFFWRFGYENWFIGSGWLKAKLPIDSCFPHLPEYSTECVRLCSSSS